MAVAAGLGWASGLRLYAVLLFTGLAGRLGWVDLPSGLAVLAHPAMLGASGFMVALEFLVDKIPGLDSLWDVLHTLIRIPAGALLAAQVFGIDQPTAATVAALLGGSLAATAHVAKTATRAAVNTSPEPFSNVGLSLVGDGMVPAGLWLSWTHPVVFFCLLAVGIAVAAGAIVLLGGFLRKLARRVARLGRTEPAR